MTAPVAASPATVLVVDDDPPIRRAVRNALGSVASRILEAETAAEAVDLAAAGRPDLIVLDLGLPDDDGRTVCQAVRAWTTCPILVLSARDDDREKVRLLEEGADDYVVKPFSPRELAARAQALLRRARLVVPSGSPMVECHGLVIDLARRHVSRDGSRIPTTPLEFELLRVLLAHAGRTLTHQQLFSLVWRRSFGDASQHVRVQVTHLRRKLERDPARPQLIVTEPGVGYRAELEPS